MKEVISWIVENYKIVILIGCSLLELVSSFVLLILLKTKKTGEPFFEVLGQLPLAIKRVEDFFGAGYGVEKKEACLQLCKEFYKSLTGVELSDDSKIVGLFSDAIERVLETPQKKGK